MEWGTIWGGLSIRGGNNIELSGKGPGLFGWKLVSTLHRHEKSGDILGHTRGIKLRKVEYVRA